MKCRRIDMSIKSVLENVSLIGMAVNTICSSLDLDAEEVYQMELCVVEAVNNCIIHAYKDITDSDVKVIFEIFSDKLVFKICDKGKVMTWAADNIDELRFDSDNLATLPECKMGFFLINEIMDEVIYETKNSINILTMTKLLLNYDV